MLSTQTIKCSFPGSLGFQLDGRLDTPKDGVASSFAIMSHCFTCSKDTLTTSRVSRGLAQYGIGVLRFDFTGLGDSAGHFADSNFSSMVDDILCAAAFLRQHYAAPATLIGHSMGGTAALLASTQIPSCQSVVTLASPSKPSHVLHHFGRAMKQLEAGRDAEINVAGVSYPIKSQFIDDLRTCNIDQALSGYDKPILAIRAGKDELVAHDDADEILAYSSADTTLFELELADHLFRNREHTDKMIAEIAAWISRH